MPPDREEDAIGATPEVVVEEMSDVTGRLGDRLWMIAPITAGVVNTDPEIPVIPDAQVSTAPPVGPTPPVSPLPPVSSGE